MDEDAAPRRAEPSRVLTQAAPALRASEFKCTKKGERCCLRPRAGCRKCQGVVYDPSALYGCKGELQRPGGRLIDWSWAGYNFGAGVPKVTCTHDIKRDFGAAGDGKRDDTRSFERAVVAISRGVLCLPPGKYLLKRPLTIRKEIVIKGSGEGKTSILISTSLRQVLGGEPGAYTNSPGFISFVGFENVFPQAQLADISASARRGSNVVMVDSTAGLKPGQWVKLSLSESPTGELNRDLHARLVPVPRPRGGLLLGTRNVVRFHSRIATVQDNIVRLERRLTLNASLDFKPVLYRFNPPLRNVGVQDLTLQFTLRKYGGHNREDGLNGIFFRSVYHSWVKNVRVLNADVGVAVFASHCTVSGVTVGTTGNRKTGGYDGHYGIAVGFGGDNLVENFTIQGKYVHDLSVTSYATTNVFANGRGQDLNFDHHSTAPYASLFTNIDVGAGTRPWQCGGPTQGTRSAALTTFWNIRGRGPLPLPDPVFGPLLNLVGVKLLSTAGPKKYAWFIEKKARLWPPDLHSAQRQYRRAARK